MFLPCSGCRSTCTVLRSQTGVLTDGSGPFQYTSDANCQWMISPSSTSQIALTVSVLSTEECCDTLQVFQCSSMQCLDAIKIGQLAGNYFNSAKTTISAIGYMLVKFTTDGGINGNGFMATWSSNTIFPSPIASSSTVSSLSTCHPFVWHDYDWLVVFCQRNLPCFGCGSTCGVFTSATGSFGSSAYVNRAVCQWVLAPIGATHITLTFTSINTESCCDFISIFRCSSIHCTDIQQLSELSGGLSSGSIVLWTAGIFLIQFTSDLAVNGDGFAASWTSIPILPSSLQNVRLWDLFLNLSLIL
jgi:hypothetical protein